MLSGVGGYVWNDLNHNGVKDTTDPNQPIDTNVPGVTVKIFASPNGVVGDQDDFLAGQTVTDANGHYQFDFSNLPSGDGFYLVFQSPKGYVFTTEHGVDNGDLSSVVDAKGMTVMFGAPSLPTTVWRYNAGIFAAPGLAFAEQMSGASSNAWASSKAVATDAAGNVYVAGYFQGTVDFDPGPNTFNLTSTSNEVYVAKYTSRGAFVWAKDMAGTTLDATSWGPALAVATDGSVYVTGDFTGTVDLDPGPGVFNSTSIGGYDIFVTKLDSAGNFLWADTYHSIGNDVSMEIAVTPDGGACVAGSTNGSILVAKMSASGGYVWTETMSGTGPGQANGVAVGTDGSVFLSGFFSGTINLNPGSGTSSHTSAGDAAAFVEKLSSAGNFVWAYDMSQSGTDAGFADIALGTDGSIYTTGHVWITGPYSPPTDGSTPAILPEPLQDTSGPIVCKLSSTGRLVWAAGTGEATNRTGASKPVATGQGIKITVGPDGNIYSTGYFNGAVDSTTGVVYDLVDFDPGQGTFGLTASPSDTAFVLELDSAGKFVWADSLDKPAASAANFSQGIGIVVGADKSVYAVGRFGGTADFAPGGDTYNLTANTQNAFLFKLLPPGLSISDVVVVENPPQGGKKDGRLDVTDQGFEITWAVNGISSTTWTTLVLIDNTLVTTIYGPYSVGGGTYFVGGAFGPLSQGTHSYTIALGDNVQANAFYSGNFDVLAPNYAISNITIAEATTKNGVVDSTDRILLTWVVTGADKVTSPYLWIDGNQVATINGPYAASDGSYTLSSVVGPLAPGTHTGKIQVADSTKYPVNQSFTFAVQNGGPVIDKVVVAEATAKNGQLDSNDQLVITWAVEGANSVVSRSLKVDGVLVASIYGPYVGVAGAWYFAGVFGPLAAGTHYYAISSAGTTGAAATTSGSFKVLSSTPTISNVVVAEATPKNGVLNSTDQLVLTWAVNGAARVASSSLNVDGKPVTVICGPYAAGVNTWYIAGVFGPLGVGTHSYTIQSKDGKGNAAGYSGSFSVVAALTVETSASPTGQIQLLTDGQLQPIVAAAEQRWASALGKNVSAAFNGVTVQLADLPAGMLGETLGKTILIDRDAAGYGWFVDSTPNDDVEFADLLGSHTLAAQKGTAAAQRVDLLTTVMHEMGHVLGDGDLAAMVDDLMNGDLPLGARRTLSNLDLIGVRSAKHESTDWLFDTVGS